MNRLLMKVYLIIRKSIFYKKQHRLVLENCGAINPEQIEEYIAVGGYEALAKAVTTMSPEDVIEEIKKSVCVDVAAADFLQE